MYPCMLAYGWNQMSERQTPENLKCWTFLWIPHVSMKKPRHSKQFFPMYRCEEWWRQRTNSHFCSSASICPVLLDMSAAVNEASAWFVVNGDGEFAQQKCAYTPSLPSLYVWSWGGVAMIWTILAFAFLALISKPHCVKIMTLAGAMVLRWLMVAGPWYSCETQQNDWYTTRKNVVSDQQCAEINGLKKMISFFPNIEHLCNDVCA